MSGKSEQFIDTNIINANSIVRRRRINAVYEGQNGRLAIKRKRVKR